MALRFVYAETPIFRLARAPDPWAFPDWRYAGPDGTFGNRFDDPAGIYRVLYGASQRLAPFLETLARYRVSPAVQAHEAIITGPTPAAVRPGQLRVADWVRGRAIGSARVAGSFVDLGHSLTLAFLRDRVAARLAHYRIDDLDAAAIRQSAPRRFTQEISRVIFEHAVADGEAVAGLYYRSKWGDELENWAVFETATLTELNIEPIAPDDTDLLTAASLLGINLL